MRCPTPWRVVVLPVYKPYIAIVKGSPHIAGFVSPRCVKSPQTASTTTHEVPIQFHFHPASRAFFIPDIVEFVEGETPTRCALCHTLSQSMSQHQRLGTCPRCETAIRPGDVLIEYSRSGTSTQYAECPSCESVIRPE